MDDLGDGVYIDRVISGNYLLSTGSDEIWIDKAILVKALKFIEEHEKDEGSPRSG